MTAKNVEQFFGITYRTWQNWKKEGRPVVDFFSKYPNLIEDFLKDGKVSDLEDSNNYSLDPVFEDYVINNMKRFHRLDRSFFNLFFPGSEFITRHLKQISSNDITNLTVNNAKEKFIEIFSTMKLTKIIDTELKRESVLEDIRTKYSKIEVYLILKYPEKFS